MKIAEPDGERPAQAGWRAIPKGIWALGLVSLFMDTFGPSSTFFVGAGITAVALVGLVALQGGGRSLRHRDEG